jgi:hypothetical protein
LPDPSGGDRSRCGDVAGDRLKRRLNDHGEKPGMPGFFSPRGRTSGTLLWLRDKPARGIKPFMTPSKSVIPAQAGVAVAIR